MRLAFFVLGVVVALALISSSLCCTHRSLRLVQRILVYLIGALNLH